MIETPLIAIAPRLLADDEGKPLMVVGARASVVQAVARAGGQPVVVALDSTEPDAVRRALAPFAGIVFPGGGDSDPALYGEPDRHPALRLVAPEQDASDVALAHAAIEIGLPTLGICRGMQLLNIVLGGSLVQHLEPSSVEHWDSTHDIVVTVSDSLTARVMGSDRFVGRSFHRQAVKALGSDLVITAVATDDCIEAIEHVSAPILGVQWHPEVACAAGPPQEEPFRWLVGEARRRTTTSRS